jgi:transposase-like protein
MSQEIHCPNCGSENVDGLGIDEVTGDTSYGCEKCNTFFVIKGEPYLYQLEEVK